MTGFSLNGFKIECVTGGPFATNAYLIGDEATRKCAVVDPGYYADEEWGQIICNENWTLDKIICTHGHIDHTCGVASLARAFPDVPVFIHRNDAPLLEGGNGQVAQFLGLPDFEPFKPTDFLEEGTPVSIGKSQFDVLFVPGHCPGHVALLNGRTLFGGDVVFLGSIGRTDLPGGDYQLLADSIAQKIMTLPDETVIYPGHGPITTVGAERLTNPYIVQMIGG